MIANGVKNLQSPWPGPDVHSQLPWPTSTFSPQQLRQRISNVYSAAINEYRIVVEKYFPKFAERLWTYGMLPVRFVARVADGIDPWMETYFWPLESHAISEIDVRFDKTVKFGEFGDICNEIYHEINRCRPDKAEWLAAKASSQRIGIFGKTPVTDLVYEWLRSDLHEV